MKGYCIAYWNGKQGNKGGVKERWNRGIEKERMRKREWKSLLDDPESGTTMGSHFLFPNGEKNPMRGFCCSSSPL